MSFKIGIVGGGWYGCHLASSLANLGFGVTVFERHGRLMHEASGNNQFRLHLGFHYARHHGTRLQSRDGFQRFIERYPTLSAEVAQNIYCVPRATSLLDFQTYKLVMAASGIDYIEMPSPPDILRNVEGAMLTRERVLLLDRARQLFEESLAGSLQLGTEVRTVRSDDAGVSINGHRFDYVIDASWGHLIKPPLDIYYEPTLLLYYEAAQPMPAITLVDGPLCSIYPTEDPQIYTLSSVVHTPLGRCSSGGEARLRLLSVGKELVTAKRLAMEDQITENVPAFRDLFNFVGVQLSIKTKPVGQFDDRSCYVFRNGRIFSVMSGKIDTIFFATERVLSMIEADRTPSQIPRRPSGLRSNILMPVAP